MVKPAGSAGYSIASVSKLTGVGCHALRVWERRYGFPRPERSPSGHRRYSADQVQTLLQITRGLRDGRMVSELMAAVLAGADSDAAAAGLSPTTAATTANPDFAVLDRLQAGDLAAAEAAYASAVKGLDPADEARRVIEPGFVEIGERWFRGECDVYQEHFASGFLRRKLDDLIEAAQAANDSPGRTAIVGTVQGDRHEGGVLMLTLALELAGWRALPLGVDVPVREYQKAVALWRPDAVCVSFILSRNVKKRFGELERIRDVPVFLGGRSLLNYQGLARRHGLFPLAGPAWEVVAELTAEVERRCSGPIQPH